MPSCSNPTKFPFYGRTIWRFLPDFPLRTFSASSPPPTHQHIARLVLDQKSASEAIQTFRWASHLSNFTHNHSTYRALIYKLCSFSRFDTVKKLLDEMPETVGSPPDEHIFVTVIRGLGRARMYRQVVQVLDLVSSFNEKPSVKIFNTILDVLVKEDIDLAREFYRKKMAGSGVQGDDYTYGILMKGLCLTNKIGDGFKLLQLIKSQGKTPNTVTYNTLLHALCKNGKIGRARSLMNEMVEPNDVTFNILISWYCREENIVQALVLLENCFTLGFIPDIITVTKVVENLCSAGRVKEAVAVLGRVESKGGSVDVVAYNKLIKGFCKLGKAKAGYHLLEEMESKGCLPNVETYNILISGFCECGLLNSALDLFHDMKTDGISWNFVTYDLLIKGLCSGGRTEDGFKILEVVEETRRAGGLHISPYNSLIYGLYKENRLNDSLEFLHKMQKLFPRTVDRSLAILGFCKDGRIEDAKSVYDQMTGEGGIPSALVYDHLIHGFCRKECVGEALELINEMVNHGFLPVASTFNALIGGFCRQGRVGSASEFMEGLVGKGCSTDRGSYNPLLDALCRKGDFEKAHRLFVLMVEKGILPDHFTWNSLLLGLSRDVLWLEANDIARVDNNLEMIGVL